MAVAAPVVVACGGGSLVVAVARLCAIKHYSMAYLIPGSTVPGGATAICTAIQYVVCNGIRTVVSSFAFPVILPWLGSPFVVVHWLQPAAPLVPAIGTAAAGTQCLDTEYSIHRLCSAAANCCLFCILMYRRVTPGRSGPSPN